MVTAIIRHSKALVGSGRRLGAVLFVCALLGLATGGPLQAASAETGLRGPDIVIIAEEERVIYEYRQNEQLRMIRIVPTLGKPYYLVPRDPTRGFGDLERADALLPSWVIVEF
jgi:hypothetical protein